jgi:hypothetical protein
MADNKLSDIIQAMSGVEKRECAKFLQSPYFNHRADVLALWRGLLRAGTAESVSSQGAGRVDRRLHSLLLQRIELFLAQRAYEATPLLADLHLAPVYRQKNLSKHLDHLFRRAGERLEKMPRDNAYHFQLYQLEWEKYAAVESRARMRENNLGSVNRALDIFLAGSKLRLACLMESHRAVYNTHYETGFLPALLKFLEDDELTALPLVGLYYYCYRALTGGAETDFRAFRTRLESQGAQLPADERRTFLLLAINYCIRRLNTGELRYVREAFDLYRVGLDTGVLLENGRLGRFAYKNIVALGLKLEAFAWVEGFIPAYEPFLEEKYRAAHSLYNLAKLHFARKDYAQAMPLLARVDESDLLLNLDSRVMLLKMYYETDEWEALDALQASFKILLLRKKKVIGYHQSHYLNTLRYVQKLSRLNFSDKKALAAFRREVENNEAVIEKEWLLQQTSLPSLPPTPS